ncbi:MAG: iron ABC transporter permease [Deltaproteobacteria bacterium]|jgi:iron complex transport system permease protein|nr:iron ABC transporter permease [Deltaproteobacteria bacterium]
MTARQVNPYFPLVILLVAVMAAALLFGQVRLFPWTDESWNTLLGFRLPRVLFAAVNGAVLALAGTLYQIALRNPLAEGFTTGAASSAALGGCLALALWGNPLLVSLSALLCAGLGVFTVCGVAARAASGGRVTIILAGIALSVMAGAGISFLKYFFEDSLSTMVFWLMGGLYAATFGKALLLLAALGLAMLFLLRRRSELGLMFLDDQSARASGVNVRALRGALFVLTTALVALSVSFCGVIGFLGLMAPHAVRALIGHGVMVQLICSPLLGAAALTLFDLISRTILPEGGELPVGIITSAAGGCFFFILLLRKGGRVWGS